MTTKLKPDWTDCCFEDLLDYEQPTKYIVESTDYNDSFETPVLTAGKSFIKGYTNETEGIFDNLPTIIFDDFTTASQFVNFKFKVKSSAMKILVPTSELVNMDFAYYAMQVNQIRSDTHKRYWISVYAKKKFLLPPLVEQRAIVAKIEELFSDLDKGIADLKKAQDQLVIFRQAVLKKAFEGELTKDWREKQTDLPSADELLEQIKVERQKHYDEQIENWKKDVKDWEKNGKEGKKPGKPKKPDEFNKTKDLSLIPNKWCTTSLNYIGFWTGGGTPSKSNSSFWENGSVLWVSPKDMKSKEISDSQDKITPESINQSSAKWIQKNSVLVVLRSGILRRTLPVAINRVACTINQDLQALTLFTVKPEYIYWYLVANDIDIRHRCAKDGVTVESVEADALKGYLFPFCAKEEQNQIVKEIDSRLSVCDKVEQSITESLEKAKALRQSILKKAFEGSLLSEEEIAAYKAVKDYEPASVLLARIKAEKLRQAQTKKKK
jgi:type I restriction enzyme S subunit